MNDASIYNLASIRSLIRDAFTADDLRRFCLDRSAFAQIPDYFGPGFDFMQMIDVVIEQCQTRSLLPDLLAAIAEARPRHYERYHDQLLATGARRRVVNLCPLDVGHTFKDRELEIQELHGYLAEPGARLISVVGRGGMGKTALVCHVLADLEQAPLPVEGEESVQPLNGLLYLSARSTGLSLERIYTDVGRMLGEPAADLLAARWAHGERSSDARVGYLLEALQDGRYIILLDNLEDYQTEEGEIAGEALRGFVERCLTQHSGVRLVATSRQEIRLPAATLPRARTITLRDGLPEADATSLLKELDPQGRLGLRDTAERDLRRVIRLTQGIPRALELVAGILDRDPRASLPRLLADEQVLGEQVVEALVAEGYARLGATGQRIMEVLAVFDRPVPEEAIAYLLQPWFPDLDAEESLRRLATSHFVKVGRLTGEYSLHPLDREYAYSQLAHDDGTDDYNRRSLELRAAQFYVNVRKAEDKWAALEDLYPHLNEFEHRIRAGDYTEACNVLESIDSGYLFLWGYFSRLAELREQLLGRLVDQKLQARNLRHLGDAYRAMGHFQRSVEYYEEALALARQTGNQIVAAQVLGSLGSANRNLGQHERGIACYEEALLIAQETGNRKDEGKQLNRLGRVYRRMGWFDRAMELYQASLVAAREVGDRRWEGYNLGTLASAYLALGQIPQAKTLYEQALVIARELYERREEGIRLGSLGIVYYLMGQAEKAHRYYEDALAIDREIGNRAGEQRRLSSIGDIYRDTGQIQQAIDLYSESLVICRQIGYRLAESFCCLALGRAMLAVGDLSQARLYCTQALELDIRETWPQSALVTGISLLPDSMQQASKAFEDATSHCRALLSETANLFVPCYLLATALVGSAVCNSGWLDRGKRSKLLAPALSEYRHALAVTSAPGAVGDAVFNLELLKATGVEGLEPVFELLQNALVKEPDPP